MGRLTDATTKACSDLEERVMVCRMRNRADVVKHFIQARACLLIAEHRFNNSLPQMFDLQFVQQLTALSTGHGPRLLSPKQLLQIIDCIEGFLMTRKRCLGAMTLSAQVCGAPGAEYFTIH